ncbi:MAG: flagellar biosynthesis protein FlhF [Steroidobacteraceae bacterium]
MKIKTYNAPDMRQALRLVRDGQGPDAIILASRQLAQGVEVTVAMDPEELAPGKSEPVATPALVTTSGSEFAALLAKAAAVVPAAAPTPPAADALIGEELRSMRHLLEWQLAQLAWNDLTRRAPALAELLKVLTEIGVSTTLATTLLRELPAGLAPEDAQRRALAQLARHLTVTGDDLLDRGGRVAFVGPTGIGKTTGIAKLAARWVMRHGTRDIALISMDDQRFGAHEQLRVLGRLLGVECYTVVDPAELPQLLQRLPLHRMVLIDTAGISPRDSHLDARAKALVDVAEAAQIDIWLTLSAGAQAGVLEESLQNFAVFRPRAVMLTKLDEAVSIGGALSALVAAGLPLSYVAEGPRIPEDLAPARAHQLVARAVLLARTHDASASDELLVRKFGGVAHAIR